MRKETPAKYIVLQRQPFPHDFKKSLFKNFLNLTRKHLYRVSIWWRGWFPAWNFIDKEHQTQVFFCKFYKIFKKTYFIEYLGATAIKSSSQAVSLHIMIKTCKWHQLRTTLPTLILPTGKMFFVCCDNFGNHHPG